MRRFVRGLSTSIIQEILFGAIAACINDPARSGCDDVGGVVEVFDFNDAANIVAAAQRGFVDAGDN